MSSYWAVECETCEVIGPQIGRTAGGMTFADPQLSELEEVGGIYLAGFLIKHGYHELRLRSESSGAPLNWEHYPPKEIQ
jgi:hypothetical protein